MKVAENKKAPIFNGLIRQEYIQNVINLLSEYGGRFTLNSVDCDIMHISLFAEFDSQETLEKFQKKVGPYMCRILY